MKLVFAIAVCTGSVACFLTWLLMMETSPLHTYLLQNVGLRNFWGDLIFPVLAVGMFFNLPPLDLIFYPLVFLQWFSIGFAVAGAGSLIGSKIIRREFPEKTRFQSER